MIMCSRSTNTLTVSITSYHNLLRTWHSPSILYTVIVETFTRERERERENCSARTQSWWRPRKRWTQGPELSRHVHISFISFHFTSLASKTCTPKFYPFVSQFSKGNAIGNLFQRPYINATLKSHLGDIRSNQTGSALICSEKNHPMIEICPFKKRWANDVSN